MAQPTILMHAKQVCHLALQHTYQKLTRAWMSIVCDEDASISIIFVQNENKCFGRGKKTWKTTS